MTDMPCPVCGEMHQCGGTFEGDDDDFERMDRTLQSAVNSAQDNLPWGYQLWVCFSLGTWSIKLLSPGLITIHGVDAALHEDAGLAGAIARAVDFAREKEGLPT